MSKDFGTKRIDRPNLLLKNLKKINIKFLPNNIWNMKRVAVWCAMVNVGINSKKFWVHKLYQKYLLSDSNASSQISAEKNIIQHKKWDVNSSMRCLLLLLHAWNSKHVQAPTLPSKIAVGPDQEGYSYTHRLQLHT